MSPLERAALAYVRAAGTPEVHGAWLELAAAAERVEQLAVDELIAADVTAEDAEAYRRAVGNDR